MVKYTQTNRRLLLENFLCVFDHFVGVALKVNGDICRGGYMYAKIDRKQKNSRKSNIKSSDTSNTSLNLNSF